MRKGSVMYKDEFDAMPLRNKVHSGGIARVKGVGRAKGREPPFHPIVEQSGCVDNSASKNSQRAVSSAVPSKQQPILETTISMPKREERHNLTTPNPKAGGVKDVGILLGRVCLLLWACVAVVALVIAPEGDKERWLIACFVVLFLGWMFGSDWLFASDKKRIQIAKKRAKEKRFELVRDGKISFDEMSWSEQIYFAYHHKSCGRNLADLIFMHQDKIVMGRKTEEEEECVTEHLVDECVRSWVASLFPYKNLDFLNFVSRYAKIINKYHFLESLVSEAYKSSISVRKEMYQKCLVVCEYEWMRENYLGRIHHLEQLEAKEAREKYRRDFAMRLRKHKQDIERKGAFSEVKSGGDYELFVAFCLKEAGADCKRVGQSGD